jgi:alpha-N-arabinofuranosidase
MMSENRTEAALNPTGLLFKMYRDHFGILPVAVSGDSPQPKPTFAAGGDQPAVNPGSPTYPLDVVAAFTEDRKALTIAVLNPSDALVRMNLVISGTQLAAHGTLWRMAPEKIDAVVTVGGQPEVLVEEKHLGRLPGAIVAPPFSVNIYVYSLQ